MKKNVFFLITCLFLSLSISTQAQVNAADSVMNHARGNRLSIGGYGEVAMSRNFYSDNSHRYTHAAQYK